MAEGGVLSELRRRVCLDATKSAVKEFVKALSILGSLFATVAAAGVIK